MEFLSESGVRCFSENQMIERDVCGSGDFDDQVNGRIPAAGFYTGKVLTADVEMF